MAWYDDPKKDYRKRYHLPEHWVMADDAPFSVDYEGYLQAVQSLLPEDGAGKRLLDAGCGDGFLSGKLVAKCFDVTGVDYSDRAIAFAKMFVPDTDFNCLDLRDLNTRPEWQGAFDYAVHVEVLEHIPVDNQPHVVSNLHWALKEGGTLVISVPSTDIRGSYTHYKHFTIDEIQQLLRDAGFEVRSILYQNKLSPLLSRRLWKILNNNFIDLVAVRNAIRRLWLRRYNIAKPGEKVGRFILVCTKTVKQTPASTG